MSNVYRGSVVERGASMIRNLGLLKLALLVTSSYFLMNVPLFAQESKTTPQEFHLTLAGDCIIVTPAMVRQTDPRFMGVVNAVRKGDAAVVNFEGTFAGDDAYPVYDSGGTWISSDPDRLKDMQWMGFNLFSASNNHALDFGGLGLLDTIKVFKQNRAVYAGIGQTLGEARAPAYLSTPHGRIALVSSASTFTAEAPAGRPRSDMRGRPGLSPLRFQTRYRVDSAAFDALRKLKTDLKLGGASEDPSRILNISLQNYGVNPFIFEKSDKPEVITTPDPRDVAEISHSIREGRAMADYVVTYIHAHEGAGSIEVPAQFLVTYAHAMVDAGADVFGASGPHVLRGIEIYKGKPIFYSLGGFIHENDLIAPMPTDLYERYGVTSLDALPSEAYDARDYEQRNDWHAQPRGWQSVVADVVFRGGHPVEVILTPISLGFPDTRADRGYPRLADSATANQILERLQKMSQPFGTRIEIKNGLGIITIEHAPSTN